MILQHLWAIACYLPTGTVNGHSFIKWPASIYHLLTTIISLHDVYSETSLQQIQILITKVNTLHADTIKVIKDQHYLDLHVFTYIYSFSCQQATPLHQGIHTLLLMACTDTDDCNLHWYAGKDLSLKQRHNFVIKQRS